LTRVAIVQPNFLPWRGAFDLIDRVDEFVFLDNVQYTRNDWRNRNRVLAPGGHVQWLTVPVRGSTTQMISEVSIDDTQHWQRRHLRGLRMAYGNAPHVDFALGLLERAYQAAPQRLVDLTIPLTVEIARFLGSQTKFHVASELSPREGKNERLIDLVASVGGTVYVSGPSATNYMQPEQWAASKIEVQFMEYPQYPDYVQLASSYIPDLSILDLLCMQGPDAPRHIWPDRVKEKDPNARR